MSQECDMAKYFMSRLIYFYEPEVKYFTSRLIYFYEPEVSENEAWECVSGHITLTSAISGLFYARYIHRSNLYFDW